MKNSLMSWLESSICLSVTRRSSDRLAGGLAACNLAYAGVVIWATIEVRIGTIMRRCDALDQNGADLLRPVFGWRGSLMGWPLLRHLSDEHMHLYIVSWN
ncbi:hypothetical protein CI102_8581 [Trichoderma harzianum]|nr:hypothetical protein CI102_8581 [Trichoderma harzianum]